MWGTAYSPHQPRHGLRPGEDTSASPHIKTINDGKVRPSIQRYRIVAMMSILGRRVDILCFVHASTGCDTTLAV